jgi:hypothetical protein
MNSADSELIQVGSELLDLHHARISADYRLDHDAVEERELVARLVKRTGELLEILDACRREPRRSQARKALKH